MAQHWHVSMPGSCKCRAVFTNGVALMSRTWEISYKEPVLAIYVLYTMIISYKRPEKYIYVIYIVLDRKTNYLSLL